MNFKDESRGFRNNNPGNIRNTTIDWKGETKGDDKGFETFESVEYGIRAIFRLLKTYREKHGLRSIREIIYRFAPPNENNTDAYIASVMWYMQHNDVRARRLLTETGENLEPYSESLMPLFVEAIIAHENGLQPFNSEFIKKCSKL
jgi:hypothetical protein